MKTNHTPGPWSVAPGMPTCIWTDAVATGRGVAVTAMNARTPEEQIANAKLIAAAPDMLAALESIQVILTPTATHCHRIIADAIAKAKGGA